MNLHTNRLYILSGLPGSGKSSWLEKVIRDNPGHLDRNAVISLDGLRDMMLGGHRTIDDETGQARYLRYQSANPAVFDIMMRMVKVRLKERLTTFVDGTFLNDSSRKSLMVLADELGVEAEVLILDEPLEHCIERDANRENLVGEAILRAMSKSFERKSGYPYRLIEPGARVRMSFNTLPHDKFDAIGDVHGLYDEFLVLLDKLGYALDDRGVPVHRTDPERKLLLLGDFIDRGTQSIEMLRFAYRAHSAGHLALMGNHEYKLLNVLNTIAAGEPRLTSYAGAETAANFLRLKDDEQLRLRTFLARLQGYVLHEDGIAFVHANVPHFHPKTTLNTELMFGTEPGPARRGIADRIDADARYSQGYPANNTYILVRGHIPSTTENAPDDHAVVSLEESQAYRGNLVALRVDAFVERLRAGQAIQPAAEASKVRQSSSFDFDHYSTQQYGLLRGLRRLEQDKLAIGNVGQNGMTLFKYSKRVFFDALWDKDPLIEKARGIVLDMGGNIVVHPFDKVFNYGENGAGLEVQDHERVVLVEKLNGFLACISGHPYREKELLLTTTGSFDSPFVGYIDALLTPRQRGMTQNFLAKNDLTLMFEAIHPEDPHIIEYAPAQHGLHLIGARGKGRQDLPVREEVLDEIAAQLGYGRPVWTRTTFGEARARALETRTEGFMVRSDDAHQTTLLKIKSPFYLVTKFIARLSEARIKELYKSPRTIKQKIDEEFYPVVDQLPDLHSLDAFLAMDVNARTAAVREIVISNFNVKNERNALKV